MQSAVLGHLKQPDAEKGQELPAQAYVRAYNWRVREVDARAALNLFLDLLTHRRLNLNMTAVTRAAAAAAVRQSKVE